MIEARDIEVRYGKVRAVDGVSFDVGAGVTGLLGPNGAGKSSLLRVLATVRGLDGGSLSMMGLDPERTSDRTAIRRRLGYMPQEPGFYRRFTAFDFVDYIAILKEMTDRTGRHADVLRVLDAVDLGDVMGKRIKSLSGGMRRRVALAQALLGDPKMVLLDEPTAGLDPELRLRFRDLISEQARDRAVLLSTHQTEDVAALCRDVIVMDRGKAVFNGSPHDLAERARGHVWTCGERPETAVMAWRTGDGRMRVIGDRPPDSDPAEPTIEDGYLMLVGSAARAQEPAA